MLSYWSIHFFFKKKKKESLDQQKKIKTILIKINRLIAPPTIINYSHNQTVGYVHTHEK